MKQVTLLVIGAGDRGATYARLATRIKPQARVVGIAEPRAAQRRRLVDELGLSPDQIHEDWSEVAAKKRFADAVIIATPDNLHAEPALAFLAKGYHVLLEKPMATSVELCEQIAEAAAASKSIFALAHVLRYTDYTQRLKVLIDSGLIGDLMAIQRLEPIGHAHFAHSFVRGNWRRERESSFSLLTKACHDIDWLRYVVGKPCRSVSSFAELRHFHAGAKPEGASDRCLECRVERSCPYSAKKIYVDRALLGERGWPLSVVTPEPKAANLIQALRKGPYGKCVYACDNDVADTQLVNLAFEGGCLASFMMTAFTPMSGRQTVVFGSRGQLRGNGETLEHFDFHTERTRVIDTSAEDTEELGGHGGGDGRLLQAFLTAIAHKDPTRIISGAEDTLEAYRVVFAAEEARRRQAVVSMEDWKSSKL